MVAIPVIVRVIVIVKVGVGVAVGVAEEVETLTDSSEMRKEMMQINEDYTIEEDLFVYVRQQQQQVATIVSQSAMRRGHQASSRSRHMLCMLTTKQNGMQRMRPTATPAMRFAPGGAHAELRSKRWCNRPHRNHTCPTGNQASSRHEQFHEEEGYRD